MSLNALALRLATVKVLSGRTWCGDNVRDSEIFAIDDTLKDEPQPFLVVYTDDGDFGGSAVGTQRDLMGGGSLRLTIEILITQRMVVQVEPTPDNPQGLEVTWRMPATDAGLELTLNLIAAQVRAALAGADGAWGEIWKQFATVCGKSDIKRGAANTEGSRFAGVQLHIPIEIPREPVLGRPFDVRWTAFLAACEADPQLAKTGQMLRGVMTAPDLPAWDAIRHGWGLTVAEARALGLLPTIPAAIPGP